ncbi:putative ribonuclease H-like domain-containing protein [Rosa chinensis]|uniref:Putative ribonuclease H-like domain-containing protein n=1 Tax=Rosa chinensis TaxID=74649 RepID=A0A2P6RVL7_ROSCH|nr:putative ribonuclease H-like domain-containing protein [Rosa chinensis]
MAIWKARNRLLFDNRAPSLRQVSCSVKAWIMHIGPYIPGDAIGTVDRQLLSTLGVAPLPRKCQGSCMVIWHPPLSPWLKLNTDGLAKGNPGPAACGGVFRNAKGLYQGGFCQGIGVQTSFHAELLAIIIGIDLAFKKGWYYLWLESDSMSVLQCIFSQIFEPPWSLRTRWLNCLSQMRSMDIRCSHIYREGNTVADSMANLGLSSSSLKWFASPPPVIWLPLHFDTVGLPYQRG